MPRLPFVNARFSASASAVTPVAAAAAAAVALHVAALGAMGSWLPNLQELKNWTQKPAQPFVVALIKPDGAAQTAVASRPAAALAAKPSAARASQGKNAPEAKPQAANESDITADAKPTDASSTDAAQSNVGAPAANVANAPNVGNTPAANSANPANPADTAPAASGSATAAATASAALAAAPVGNTAALPASVPPPMRLHFEAAFLGMGGVPIVLEWRHDGKRYTSTLTLQIPLRRAWVQKSEGLLTPAGLQPLRFAEFNRSERAVHFERNAEKSATNLPADRPPEGGGQLIFSATQTPAWFAAGTQDRQSLVIQLSSWAAGISATPHNAGGGAGNNSGNNAAEALKPGTVLQVPMVSPKSVALQRLQIGEHAPLEVASLGKTLHTVRIRQLATAAEQDVRIDTWLAKDLGYLPVKLHIGYGRYEADAVLVKVEPL